MSAPIVNRHEWTEAELVRSFRLYYKAKPWTPMQWTLGAYCLLTWGIGVHFWNTTGSLLFLGFMVLMGILPLVVKGPMRRQIDLLALRRRVQEGVALEIRVGDEGVELLRGGVPERAWGWGEFYRAGLSPDGIVLLQKPNAYVWLPDAGYGDPSDRARVEDLLERKTTTKAV